jgi:hypothetical protein
MARVKAIGIWVVCLIFRWNANLSGVNGVFNPNNPLDRKTVMDGTTSHFTKQPKDGGKWLVIPRRWESK